jgi:hypothetical protein
MAVFALARGGGTTAVIVAETADCSNKREQALPLQIYGQLSSRYADFRSGRISKGSFDLMTVPCHVA